VLAVYMNMTLSFENVKAGEALSAAYYFWDRASEKGNTVCSKEAKALIGGSGCYVAVRVITAGSAIEPENFAKGVALCMIDPGQIDSFLYHCMLMTMETKDGNLYVKSAVGPTRGGGGGTISVDSFGTFWLSCHF